MYANFNIIIIVVVGHINFVAQVVDKETSAVIFDTTRYCNTVADKLCTYIFLTVKVKHYVGTNLSEMILQ